MATGDHDDLVEPWHFSTPHNPDVHPIAAGYLPVAMALSIAFPIRSAAASTSRSLT